MEHLGGSSLLRTMSGAYQSLKCWSYGCFCWSAILGTQRVPNSELERVEAAGGFCLLSFKQETGGDCWNPGQCQAWGGLGCRCGLLHKPTPHESADLQGLTVGIEPEVS